MDQTLCAVFSLLCLAPASCLIDKELGPGASDAAGAATTAVEPDAGSTTDPLGASETDGGRGPVDPPDDAGATGPSATTDGAADVSCRDAVACTTGCVLAMSRGDANLDLLFTCLLGCETDAGDEAIDTYQLVDCVTGDCIAQGQCDELKGQSTGTESPGSSTSGGSDDDACLTCIILALDAAPQPGAACADEAAACM